MILVTFLTFIGGLTFLFIKYGVLDSVSAYYYAIQSNYRFLFSVWLAAVGILLLNGTDALLLELSAYMIIGVACCEAYKDNKYVNFFHFLFAYLAIIFGCLNILSISVGLGIISACLIVATRLFENKNAVLYSEIVAFILVILTQLI